MSDFDPMSSFISRHRAQQAQALQRLREVEVLDEPGTRKFLDAKLELQRVNWACGIGLKLRHGLLNKVTGKI